MIAVFPVPSNKIGTVWTVFELDGDKIIPVNTFSNEPNSGNIQSFSLEDGIASESTGLFTNLPDK